MATNIQIKRSANVAAPNTVDLLQGELAYSYDKNADGAGAKLYIEALDSNNNEVIHIIGGKYYTDIIDSATSSNTANKLVKRDSTGSFTGNIITANQFIGEATSAVIANTANALTNGIYINLGGDVVGSAFFDGTGNANISATVIQANSVELGTDTTGDYVANVIAGSGLEASGQGGETANITLSLTDTGVVAGTYGGTTNIPVFAVDGKGRITTVSNTSISTDLLISGDSGTDTVSLATETLHVTGVDVISTSVSGNAITITNNGVKRVESGGYGLTTSASTGNITITNTGVTRVESSGHGIVLDANNGNVTITNTGVTGVIGTANEIEVNAATGNIQIGLPNDVTIGNNLTVTGDLIVNGSAITLNTATITVEDPLVKFGNANPADSLDIGFFGEYTNSGTKYAGLFRDASDSGKFKLFVDLTSDPTTNVVNDANYTIATLVANLTGGTVSGLTANIDVSDGGTGRGTLTTNAVLFGQGTSAVGLVTGSAGQILQINQSGVPEFAGIDGGTY